MIITLSIQTKVHIVDTSNTYSTGLEAVIMDNLKQRFEGFCYMSCLILEILEIQRTSNFIFSRQRQDTSATGNVTFTVRGVVIKKYEIIHDCIVKNIDKDGHIICSNKHSAVYIRTSEALQSIKKGQTIVALAGIVKYKLYKPEISINALPFIPIADNSSTVIYTVVVNNTSGIVRKILDTLNSEIKKNADLDDNVYAFFTDLIYPYKSKKKYTSSKLATKTLSSIAGLSNGTTLTLSRPDWVPRDSPIVLIHDKVESENILGTEELQETTDGIVITETYDGVVGYFIHTYLEHILLIRQLCISYNTMDLVNNNSNVWEIYKKHRHN
jgi:hypothetical protein